jgi:hypothetical protein
MDMRSVLAGSTLMSWPDCKKHDGRHLDVHGQCVHRGAPVALRPSRCVECGAETMRRLDLTDGTVTTIEAGSDQPHRHAAPIRVELDPETLASAIVSASRAARQERQQQQEQPSGPVLVASDPPMPRDDRGVIEGVPIVRPDDGSA